jgi:SAM-dependent methyltransferase
LTDDHGYRGLVAAAYDLHGPPYEDAAFYRERIKAAGGPALEIGSGTGRLLIPYRQAGLDVEGVEPSDEMLAICREKASAAGIDVVVHQQYAQELDLKRRYHTIYIPVSTFQLIADLDDAKTALKRFHEYLAPRGQLLVSLFIPRQEEMDANNEWRLSRRLRRPDDGAMILVSIASRAHRDRQLIRSTFRYELFDEDGLLVRTEMHGHSLRWYQAEEFRTLLKEAAYSEIASTDDVVPGPADASRLMMFRAVR